MQLLKPNSTLSIKRMRHARRSLATVGDRIPAYHPSVRPSVAIRAIRSTPAISQEINFPFFVRHKNGSFPVETLSPSVTTGDGRGRWENARRQASQHLFDFGG